MKTDYVSERSVSINVNIQDLKLGKQPPKFDSRTLLLKNYITEPHLSWCQKAGRLFGHRRHRKPTPTPTNPPLSWSESNYITKWPLFGNDKYGDCVEAMGGHVVELEQMLGQHVEPLVTDQDIFKAYTDLTGFNPNDPSTDNGTNILDFLNYWRQVGLAGHKIAGFAALNPRDINQWRAANWLFGNVCVGIALPITAQSQVGKEWTVVSTSGDGAPNSWGGHAIPFFDYYLNNADCITWGLVQAASWQFIATYCVAPKTKILTNDLRWVEANTINEGDLLMGFDEEPIKPKGKEWFTRHWCESKVNSCKKIKQPCFDLAFDDGTKIRCSEDHKWLVSSGNTAHWMTTKSLRCSPILASSIIKPVDVWNEQTSREAGYLAAAFDGEACLSQRDLSNDPKGVASLRLTFSQKDNEMLEEVDRCLELFKFPPTEIERFDGVYRRSISQRKEVLRFLGSMRPHRLLKKFNPELVGQLSAKSVRLVEKIDVGVQEVISMQTSSGTFFAEGLASHNCDEAYVVFDADLLSNITNISPEGFNASQLLADLGQFHK